MNATDITTKIKSLGLTLPTASTPAGSYIPTIQHQNLLFVSGQIPILNGEIIYQGKVGKDISKDDGRKAAELCALNILSQALNHTEQTKSKIKRIIKLGGFVSCTPEFTDHPEIINGASDLMMQIFGENGQHTRFAVGAPSLPRNVAVEIEAILEIS